MTMVEVPALVILIIGFALGFVSGVVLIVITALKYKGKEDNDGKQGKL